MRSLEEVLAGDIEPDDDISDPGLESDSPVDETVVESAKAEARSEPDDESAVNGDDPDDGGGPEKLLSTVRATRKERDDEKRRRREMEAENAALRVQLQVQAPTPDPVKQPEFFDGTPEEYIAAQVDPVRQVVQDVEFNTVLRVSAMLARGKHDDFDETVKPFIKTAEANPLFMAQVRQSDDPAGLVYQEAKRASGADSDEVTALKARIEALENGESEDVEDAPVKPRRRASPPKSNAGSRGSGARAQKAFRPRSMSEILKRE